MSSERELLTSAIPVREPRMAGLKQQISDLERQVKTLQEQLSDSAESCFQQEIAKLKKWSWIVAGLLIVAVSLSAWLTVVLLVSDRLGTGELRNCVACLIASVLGSSTSALISALDRRAHGWEISGVKIPSGSGERFNEKMVPFFVARPFLGFLTGLLVFSASRAELLLNREPYPAEPASVNELVFYSLLAGLFAKTLIEKLKALFDKVFGG